MFLFFISSNKTLALKECKKLCLEYLKACRMCYTWKANVVNKAETHTLSLLNTGLNLPCNSKILLILICVSKCIVNSNVCNSKSQY